MTVGAGAAFNKSWEKSSLSFNGAYTHLGLYNAIFESRDEWIKSPQSYAGELVYRQKFGKALWKTYLAYDGSDLELNQFHINAPNGEFFGLDNKNLYANTSVNIPVFKKSDLLLGGSLGTSKNNFNLDGFLLEADAYGVFGRAELNSKLARNFRLIAGSSIDHERLSNTTENGHSGANNLLWNAYTEAQWTFAPRIGIKGGLRSTYSSMLEKWYLQPRAELAFQLSANQNLSLAYGKFAQMPSSEYWISAEKMGFQSANQVMLNYLFQGEKNILRAEIYHKTYQDLVTYNSQENNFYNGLGNDGKGYANGLDVFWRNDNDLIPALDFWVSYSYLDSERLYQDFPVEAQPAYVSKHNLNWVNKYWINSLRSQLGVTYNFTSGRPYTNPNSNEFLGERMKVYHTVDLGWSYLISQQKILYISVSNVFNFKNEFGHRYSSVPNAQGFFDSEPIVAQNNQFFFVGFFWTISTDKSKNQLDNL